MRKLLTLATVILFLFSFAYATPVSDNGKLKLVGNQLSSECGNPVQLKGISSMGLQWFGIGQCLSTTDLDYMVNTIGIDVFRAAMYVNENGYLTDKTKYENMVNTLVDWCEARGIYVIIDWHILNPGDPNASINDAKTFWTNMANRHKGKKHVLYEICNEPNGVAWSVVKTYANTIIPIIRAIDPDTIIIVGTPNWSQLGTAVANDKLNYTNIMYTFHFYAAEAAHTTSMVTSVSDKLPIFCTEWGVSEASGTGNVDTARADTFLAVFNGSNPGNQIISWAGWSWCDKNETSAYLQSGSCGSNPPRFTTAGNYVVSRIQTNPNNWTACSAVTNTPTRTITPGGPTFTPTITPTPFAGLLVNCGGPVYTNAEGTWQADKAYVTGSFGYVGGTLSDRGNITIGNTADSVLYQTERYADPLEYRFDIPNGTYTVTFKMCESYWGNTTGGTGSRIFDIVAEGNVVANNLDLYALAGYNNAYDVTVNITVSDGQLTVTMPADADNGLLHAIKILPYQAPTNTPTRTNTHTATSTYTYTRTNTFTATYTNTSVPPTATHTPSRTSTSTSTDTAVPPTFTHTPTRTSTFTQTYTDTVVPPTMTFTNTRTNTFTHTYTNTPTVTATSTSTPVTPALTFTATNTSTNTAVMPTFTHTSTNTSTATHTDTNTATITQTYTMTNTPPPGYTDTFTHTITNTYTNTHTLTSTPTFTYSDTETMTNTPTYTVTAGGPTFTNTVTEVYTASYTPTLVSSATPENTATPRASEAGGELKVKEITVYPNPCVLNNGKGINVKVAATKNITRISCRIYTMAYRLIREEEFITTGSAMEETVILKEKTLKKLSNGTYYIVITVKSQQGETAKSKVSQIILLK